MPSSPGLAGRLAAAEDELERLQQTKSEASPPIVSVEKLLADLPKRAAHAVASLEQTLAQGDIPRARQEIRDKVGTVTVEADE